MNYKLSIVVPLIILTLSLGALFWMITGDGLNLDIDLKGGNQITAELDSPISKSKIEESLSDYSVNVRSSEGINKYTLFIEFDSEIETTEIIDALETDGYVFDAYSVQSVKPTLGKAFFQQSIFVLILAFVFMAITIFIIFRTPIISFYISLSPLFDIIEALAISQLLGMKLSLASFAALLMIIGYSVDDDVMITTRVVKGVGEIENRLKNSFKTSATTTIATIVSLISLYVLSLSPVITQIASILLIGLIVDFQNTWLFNVPLLRWYMESKEK